MKPIITAAAIAVMCGSLSADYLFPSPMPPGGKNPDDVKQYICFDFDDNAYSGLKGTQFEPDPRKHEANWKNSGFVGVKADADGVEINEGEMGFSWAATTLAYTDAKVPEELQPWDASVGYKNGAVVSHNGKFYKHEGTYESLNEAPGDGHWLWKPYTPNTTTSITSSKSNPDGTPIRFSFSMLSGLFVPTWGPDWKSRESEFGYYVPSQSESKDHKKIAVSWGREQRISLEKDGASTQENTIIKMAKMAKMIGHEIGDHTVDHMESNSPLPGPGSIHDATWNADMGFGAWGGEGFNSTNENVTPWATFVESEEFGQDIGHTAQNRGWVMYAGRHISKDAWKGTLSISKDLFNRYLDGHNPIGFRAPRLEMNSGLLHALKELGYKYDCSVEAGYEPGVDGKNITWPYTMDNGHPNKAYQISTGWGKDHDPVKKTHGHPYGDTPDGLWEMPVQVLVVPEDIRDDVWANHAKIRTASPDGKFASKADSLMAYQSFKDDGKITGFDFNVFILWGMTKENWLKTMKHAVTQRKAGGKAPLLYGVHTDYYTPIYDNATLLGDFNKSSYGLNVTEGWNTWKTRIEAMEEFVAWGVENGCHFVTMEKLIEELNEMQKGETVGKEKTFKPKWNFIPNDLVTTSTETSTGDISTQISLKPKTDSSWPTAIYRTDENSKGFLKGMTHLSLTYRTQAPIALGLVYDDGSVYDVKLSNIADRDIQSGKIPVHAFQPEWYDETGNSGPVDLNRVVAIQAKLITGQEEEEVKSLMLKDLKLYGAALDDVSITPNTKKKSSLAIQGVVNGKLQLNVPTAGSYSISIMGMNGRMIHEISNKSLTEGGNALHLNLPAGVFIAQLKAADGVTATQRIMIR